jgi:hypothetical protein
MLDCYVSISGPRIFALGSFVGAPISSREALDVCEVGHWLFGGIGAGSGN